MMHEATNSRAFEPAKRKEKTTPFGVNLLRSPVLYRAAQGPSKKLHLTDAHVRPGTHVVWLQVQSLLVGRDGFPTLTGVG